MLANVAGAHRSLRRCLSGPRRFSSRIITKPWLIVRELHASGRLALEVMTAEAALADIPAVWKKESAEAVQYEKEQKELQAAYKQLKAVYGISQATAHKLVYQDGVRSLAQLAESGKLSSVQQLGLKYYDSLKQKIPRAEMEALAAVVREAVHAVDPNIFMEVCGSYRRGAPATGDLDVLLAHPEFTVARKETEKPPPIIAKVVAKLTERGFILDKLSQGALKYIGVCRLSDAHIPRQVDLKLFPWESVPTGLLHLTGSGEHNRQMRDLAIRRGYKLSEYGLYYMRGCNGRQTGFVPVSSEQDIFQLLGAPYIPPEHRSL